MRAIRSALAFALLGAALLPVGGCEFLWGDPLGFSPAQQKLARQVFARPAPSDRLRMFDSLSVADQYAVFRYGCTREPPASYLTTPLARHGAELVPMIRGRLATRSDLGEVRDDLALLTEIRRLGTADVAGDSGLMTLLRKRVSMLRSPLWREGCGEQLAALSAPDSATSDGQR